MEFGMVIFFSGCSERASLDDCTWYYDWACLGIAHGYGVKLVLDKVWF